MKIIKTKFLVAPYWLMMLICAGMVGLGSSHVFPQANKQASGGYSLAGCAGGDFFGLVPWYNYLACGPDGQPVVIFTNNKSNSSDAQCSSTGCGVDGTSSGLGATWLIALAVVEDLMRVAGFAAVIMLIVGGIRYTMSSGEPQNTQAAKGTIVNAIIGLIISVIAATTVAFIANKLGGS